MKGDRRYMKQRKEGRGKKKKEGMEEEEEIEGHVEYVEERREKWTVDGGKVDGVNEKKR